MDPAATRTNLRSRAEELFQSAVELPPKQQEHFLDQSCGPDAELRRAVTELLRVYGHGASDFLCAPAVARAAPAGVEATDDLPARIGQYLIVRKIGEGGMGIVFEARQQNPQRSVALKVIRPTFMSTQLLRRFQNEAQVLGRLQHQGIAQIYEAGVAEVELPRPVREPDRPPTATRLPYFAMEYVRGFPLAQYVREHRCDARQRLELVAHICDAVHYAHQRGVIHRDLKPANILVVDELQIADCKPLTPESGVKGRLQIDARLRTQDKSAICNLQSAIPKILDFGIARVTDSDVQVTTLQSGAGQIIGTISYMSPEQACGDPAQLDVRSDVYSIGVMLYELLAGRQPHNLANRSIPEAIRIIQEEEPSRLSSIDAHLRGDVETIVAKSLEKDRLRRYASAAELAADIRRHLRDEPIAARPASALYQVRKFARRHRGLVGGAALAFVALAVGLVATALYALRADASAALAQFERKQSARAAYRANLAAATAALDQHNAIEAQRHLEAVPLDQRGWEWRHLYSRLDMAAVVLTRLPRGGFQVQFEQGGSVISACLPDPPVYLRWDAASGAPLPDGELPEGACPLVNATGERRCWLSPDQRLIVEEPSSGWRQTWHLTEFVHDGPTPWPPLDADLADLSSDGTHLIANSAWLTTSVLDIAGQRAWSRVRGTSMYPGAYAMSSDERIALTPDADEHAVVYIWNPHTDKTVTLQGADAPVTALAFSQDGRRLVGGGQDTLVRLWDSESGELLSIGAGHRDAVCAVAINAEGSLIASRAHDRTIRTWESTRLRPRSMLHGTLESSGNVRFAPDGSGLLAWDSTSITQWSVADEPQVLRGHTSFVYPAAFSPDGSLIASGGWDHSVRLWDTASGTQVAEFRGHAAAVLELQFSSDGRQLMSADIRRELCLWDLATGTEPTRRASVDGLNRYAFSRDGSRVATSIDITRGTIGVWDPQAGTLSDAPLSAARDFPRLTSPDGASLVAPILADPEDNETRTYKSVIHVIDVPTGRLRHALAWSPSHNCCHAYSPPSARPARIALAEGTDGSLKAVRVRIIDLASGRDLGELRGHSDEIFTVAWSPDGQRIATAGRDSVIRLWDANTFDELARLAGHTSYVWSLAWSPDGERLVSGSGDYTLRIWETQPLAERVRAGRERAKLEAQLAPRVDELWSASGDAGAVSTRLREDATLTPRERQVASQLVLSRATSVRTGRRTGAESR